MRRRSPLALALVLALLAACGVEASSDGASGPVTTPRSSTTEPPDGPGPDDTTTTTEDTDDTEPDDPEGPLDRDEYVDAAVTSFGDVSDLGAPPRCYGEAFVDTIGPTPFADAGVSADDLAASRYPGTLLELDDDESTELQAELTLALAKCELDLGDLFVDALGFSPSEENLACVNLHAAQPLAKSLVQASFDPEVDPYARGMGSLFQALGRCPATLTELTVVSFEDEGTTVSPEGVACLNKEFKARGETFVGLGGDQALFQKRLQEAVLPCASKLGG